METYVQTTSLVNYNKGIFLSTLLVKISSKWQRVLRLKTITSLN